MGASEPSRTPSTAAPDAVRAARADDRLPALLESLQLTKAQRAQLKALRTELEERLSGLEDAGGELALAVAKSVRRCDADAPVLETASSWAVVVADQARGEILDAIDRLHVILTPAQRRSLADQLLGRERQSREEDDTDEGASALGDELGLSVGQMFKLLTRALALRSELEARIEPWRGEARRAIEAFREPGFAIRDHAIAEVPAAAIGTRFMRDALRTLLPILEREQCVALADLIERELAKQEQRSAERRARRDAKHEKPSS